MDKFVSREMRSDINDIIDAADAFYKIGFVMCESCRIRDSCGKPNDKVAYCANEIIKKGCFGCKGTRK